MVVVDNLSKSYDGSGDTAVNGIDLEVREGSCVSLLGPSGCGKTTTLRCIAGLEHVTGGRIVLDGKTVSSQDVFVPANKRDMGMVFQSYALWPHMKVVDNVAYPLRRRGVRATDARAQAAERLAEVGLGGLEQRYPGALSGGQQQRVAVARALAGSPRLLLFDEPLSNLDARLRERMRLELRELQQRIGFTSIYVTHDQAEAMVISDEIVIMQAGNIVAKGPPRSLYKRLSNRFAADFIGNVNYIEGSARRTGPATVSVKTSLGEFLVQSEDAVDGGQMLLAIRSQFIDLLPLSNSGPHSIVGTVQDIVFLGDHVEYQVTVDDVALRVVSVRPLGLDVGSQCEISVVDDGVTAMPTLA